METTNEVDYVKARLSECLKEIEYLRDFREILNHQTMLMEQQLQAAKDADSKSQTFYTDLVYILERIARSIEEFRL